MTAPIPSLPTTELILPFESSEAILSRVGGKGMNLAWLARAGYPVPPCFLITVAAYEQCTRSTPGLLETLDAALAGGRLDDPAGLEQVSEHIRALFTPEMISARLAAQVREGYAALGGGPVAVRSSATAEDLPDLSFAGQQDTYLNVVGEEALLRAIANCWGSLWTARAIGYRRRQGVDQHDIALAVVVQCMVHSESAGVLFTANPLTGLRTETVIDATFGLGEALVSGKVEPDRYVVDAAGGRILEKKLGAKALSIRGTEGGGVETVSENAPGRQALPDEQILALAKLGQRVAGDYGAPQDIEWAWAGGKLFLLQSRPITSLFPVPEGAGPEDLRAFFSFGAVQGVFSPVTPLGADGLRLIFATFGYLFGFNYTERTQRVLRIAGARLWVDVTTIIRNPFGRKIIPFALRWIEPSVWQNLQTVWNDPRLMPTDRRLKASTLFKLLRFFVPAFGQVLRYWLAPEKRAVWILQQLDDDIARERAVFAAVDGSIEEKLTRRAALLRHGPEMFRPRFPVLLPALIAAMAQFNLLLTQAERLDEELGQGDNRYAILAMEATRGGLNNVTTEMDLTLWETARAIRGDPESRADFRALSSAELAAAYQSRSLPAPALAALDRFMKRYELRGLAEIDLGRPRWAEDPTHVMEVLGSYLQIEDSEQAPDVVFARGERAGQDAIEKLAAAARRTRGGWLRARLIRFAARRVHILMGLREAPKFYAIRMLGLMRMGLLESGRELAAAGRLERADDLFYLYLSELEDFASGKPGDWKGLVAARRAVDARERQRRQIPRLLMSDGRAFYEGISAPIGASDDTIHGDPVSPGQAEGNARVVFDPRGAQLAPGEIMVCPGTDPSWTPLFLAAGGLVMETGGMMTHGAVVAREYGIPAVVGVHEATSRLKTGQRIRVNGSTGEITIVK